MPIVRTYPIGEVSPQPLPNVAPNVSAAGELALFGADRARDLQVAGQQLGQASDTLFALYERKAQEANETRVQDLNNQFIGKMQDVLRTGPNAFSRLKGADAIQAAGAVTETLQNLKAEVFGQAANAYQRNRLGPILDTHVASATEQIARHVEQQQEVYDRNVAAASIEVAEREATSNPDNLAGAATRAADATRVIFKGQAPEVIESEVRRAVSQVVSNVIRDRLITNNPSAVGLYLRYQSQLDPKDRIALGAAVATLSNTIAAADWVKSRSTGSWDNNVGNIVVSKYSYAGGKGTTKGAFETFVTPEQGVAAAYMTIKAKADQNGGAISFGDLIGGNVDRGGKVRGWAPAAKPGNADALLKGNDPQSYASVLARSVGLQPDDSIPLDDDAKMAAILRVMNRHEKGKQTVPDEAYAGGIKLARGERPTATTGDQALDAVNAATGMGPSAAAAPSADARPDGEGMVDYRRQMFDVEERRLALTRQNEQQFANDPARMRANQAAIEADYTTSKATLQLAKDRLYAGLQDYLAKGGPGGGPAVTMPPAMIMSQLTDQQQSSVERQINRNTEGKKAQTDNGLWYGLMQGLTSDNTDVREKWAGTNLMQFKEHLSDEDFKKLAALQADVRKGDGSALRYTQMINQVVNDALVQAQVDPTPRPGGSPADDAAKVAKFHRAFHVELELLEQKKGKATRREAQEIVDRLMQAAVRGGWFSRDTPVFMIGPADVPAADREQIVSAIRKAGGIPTDERVAEVYRHRLVLQPRQTKIPPPVVRRGEGEMRSQVLANRRLSTPGAEPGFARPSLPPRAVPRVIDDPPDPAPSPVRGGISVPVEGYDLNSHDATVRRMRQRLGLE